MSTEPSLRCLCTASARLGREVLEEIGLSSSEIGLFLPKMLHFTLVIRDLGWQEAAVIDREISEVGGGMVRAGGAAEGGRVEAVISGTRHQLSLFSQRISSYSGILKGIAEGIEAGLGRISAGTAILKTARREITIGERTLVMGILNVTPDSFSDGGKFTDPQAAADWALNMAAEGADIIDVGGESTRPGSDPVSREEELNRVIPVIKKLAEKLDIPISVDTMKADVALAALEAGAEIINDVSAMTWDKEMAEVVARRKAAVILMHMRGRPKTMQEGDLEYRSVCGDVMDFLRSRIESALDAGIGEGQIMIDPGIGFGKKVEDNLRLIRNIGEFKVLGRPIVIGVSRKSFIGHVIGGAPAERLEGTAAAVTAAILNGANVVRVHDVREIKKVAAMADALR